MSQTTAEGAPLPVGGTIKYNLFNGTDMADVFYGGQGTDVMYGGQGSDRLYGGSGKDVFYGGTGKDYLYGGSGEDTFVYNTAGEAGKGSQSDVIGDFKSGVDHLDLSGFMAGGHFIGDAAFTLGDGPAVRYSQATGVLQGDLNGDGKVDFAIVLANHTVLTEADITF